MVLGNGENVFGCSCYRLVYKSKSHFVMGGGYFGCADPGEISQVTARANVVTSERIAGDELRKGQNEALFGDR